jgi:hypothetical protein
MACMMLTIVNGRAGKYRRRVSLRHARRTGRNTVLRRRDVGSHQEERRWWPSPLLGRRGPVPLSLSDESS